MSEWNVTYREMSDWQRTQVKALLQRLKKFVQPDDFGISDSEFLRRVSERIEDHRSSTKTPPQN